MGDSRDGEELISAAQDEEDPEIKVLFLAAAFELGNANACLPLVEVVQEKSIFAEDAYDALRAHVQFEFTRAEITKFVNWWNTNKNKIVWDASSKTFGVLRGVEKHG